MTTDLEVGLYIFMLAGFLGYHLITRIPPLLHTPLMSATNAIAAISLVGSLLVAGRDGGDHHDHYHLEKAAPRPRRDRQPDAEIFLHHLGRHVHPGTQGAFFA